MNTLDLSADRRTARLLSALALSVALVLGAAGCSSSGTSGSGDAKKAASALAAGLKAHAAGNLTVAAADYKTTLKYDPTNKFAFYNLALIDVANSNYGLAEQEYGEALKSDPSYEPALFNLAILRTSSDPTQALSLYRRAVVANPKDASAWLNLGLLLRSSGQKNAGNKDVLHAIALNPSLKDPAKG